MTYEWQSNLGAYVATGWDEETPVRTLHIRGEVDGLDVVAVARGAFEDQEGIVYLIIDEGITSIGENAFGRCTGLRAVVLPEGLERIDEEAFAFCTGLTTVTIPSTVTDLYAHSFTGCTGVTDVYFLMTDASQLDEFAWWDGHRRRQPLVHHRRALPGHRQADGSGTVHHPRPKSGREVTRRSPTSRQTAETASQRIIVNKCVKTASGGFGTLDLCRGRYHYLFTFFRLIVG